MSGDPKQRLFEAIRQVIEASDELRCAKEEYDTIFLTVEGRLAEKKPVEVSPEAADRSSAGPLPADEAAAGENMLANSADDSILLSDRPKVLAYLIGIYPVSCSMLQIARKLRVDLERIVSALELLTGEGMVEYLGHNQWRYKKPTENP